MSETGQASLDFLVSDDAGLRAILDRSETIAVVGLSSNPARPSHRVARQLIDSGYTVVPVNPNESEVLGIRAVPDLKSIAGQIDIVDVFRRPSEVGPHVDEAIQVGVRVLWLQDGVLDRPSATKAHAAGLTVVMDRCIARDLARLSAARGS